MKRAAHDGNEDDVYPTHTMPPGTPPGGFAAGAKQADTESSEELLGDTLETPSAGAVGASSPARTGSSQVSNDLPTARFAAGTLLADRYRIVRLLGRGGMGAVYQAEDLTLEVQVALKFLTSSLERNPEKLELFLNEVRLARQITHPNVCRVYDVGAVDGLHFLSMEYVHGEDLASLLKRVGRLPKDRALKIGTEIARGLEAAHERGILHRDLKPANLMIDGDGRARITDFGLASFTGGGTDSAVIAGTPVYMAPEQGAGEVSAASDVYSLGLVLYELFTGRRAFARPQLFRRGPVGEEPRPLALDDLDPRVEQTILACLEPEPDRRPASAGEVAAVLERGAAPPWRPAAGMRIPHRHHWVLDRRLGTGGFGEAWLAVHSKTRDRRVFKFCHDFAKLKTFQREITLFRLLKEELGRRDDIVSILEWSLDEPPYFIEVEYSSGGNLREWAERRGGLASVPLETRLEIVAEVASALAAAHSVGVMHKDVKPTNVLIQEASDGTARARLCDFGIGTLTERGRLESAGITIVGLTETQDSSTYAGTRLYMAPEVLEGKTATLPADVYALGVLLYQVVAGDFARALASGWQRDVEDELIADDVAAAVEGSPERRLAASQLAERLRSLPERRSRLEADERLRREAELARAAVDRARRRRKWIAVALGVLLLLAGVLAVGFEQAEKTAEKAVIEQTLKSHEGMARIAAAAVDRNLAAVKRRVEREAEDENLLALVRGLETGANGRAPLQRYTDRLYREYKDRHFYSWVVADRRAVAQARSPYDEIVVGTKYAYREWFSGVEEAPGDDQGEVAAKPREELGLTLAFESTAEGNPILMSVAAPIASAEEVLGVLAATLHMQTFNEWLEVTESRAPGEACPDRFVLLLHRGQLLRHPCPELEAARPPVDRAGFWAAVPVQDLLERRESRTYRDPLRPRAALVDLAVAAPLPTHPEWTVIVVQNRAAALRPLTRLSDRLRLLGQVATAVGGVVLALLVGLVWHGGRRGPTP